MAMKTTKSWRLISILFGLCSTFQVADAAPDDLAETSAYEEDGGITIDHSGKSPVGFFQGTLPTHTNPDFARFNAQHHHRWQAAERAKDGKIRLLYGAASQSYPDGPETAAISFLKESHDLFGLKSDLSDVKAVKVDKTALRDHVRFRQIHNGVPVMGGELLVHTNKKNQVTMVQNSLIADVRPTNKDNLSEETAKTAARQDIQNRNSGTALAESKAEKIIIPFNGAHKYIWKIATSTSHPFAYWVYHIDAETGVILYKADEILHIRSGKGNAYKTNANWHAGKISKVSLKNMYTVNEGNTSGWLWGTHSLVLDYNGNDPTSTKFSFLYDPAADKDYFDAVHTYYQHNTIWAWWKKNVVSKYSFADPSYFYDQFIPVIVNIDGYCNAGYASNIGLNNLPGIIFGDENSCAPGSEDIAIDVDVFRHEFTHAVMDWSGFNAQFDGDLNGYGRSMGEGNADWYAFLYTPNDPQIGDVAFALLPQYIRNLDNTRMYPRDVDYPDFGTPEEHYTGEIWGGYLYDLYKILKKKAIPYVFQSSYYFTSAGGHQDGSPDFFDGIMAQINAELDLTGKLTSSAKVWGAATSRGLNALFRAPYSHPSDYFYSGASGSDSAEFIGINFPPVKSIKTKGNLLQTGDTHEYVIKITESLSKLSAKVKASKTDGILAPQLNLYDATQTLVAAGTTSGNTASVSFENIAPGWYVLVVTGQAGAPARGNYSFEVKAKN
jgi:Zn-dependent metalloprotease